MTPRPRAQSFPWILRTSRLELRALTRNDAAEFLAVVAANREHLGSIYARLLQFGDGQAARAALVNRLDEVARAHRRGVDAGYGVYLPDQGDLIGGCGLHARIGAGALEIGYWIARDHTQRGYAKEAVAAISRVSIERHEVRALEIHCDRENAASNAVARALGFSLHAEIKQCILTPDGPARDSNMWRLSREAYLRSPAAQACLQAFDRAGLPLELPSA